MWTAAGAQVAGNGILPFIFGEDNNYENAAYRLGTGLAPIAGAGIASRFTSPTGGFKNFLKRMVTPAVASPLILMPETADAREQEAVTYLDPYEQVVPSLWNLNPGQSFNALNGVEDYVKGVKINHEGFPVTVGQSGREYYPTLDELVVTGNKSKSKGATQAARDLERGFGAALSAPTEYFNPLWSTISGLGEIADTWALHNENNRKEEQIRQIEELKKYYNR